METLAERLERALAQSGKRKKDLADCVGVTTGAISQWFTGDTKTLKGKSAIKAAACLGVNALWLIEGTGDMRPSGQQIPPDLISDALMQDVLWLIRNQDSETRTMFGMLVQYTRARKEQEKQAQGLLDHPLPESTGTHDKKGKDES